MWKRKLQFLASSLSNQFWTRNLVKRKWCDFSICSSVWGIKDPRNELNLRHLCSDCSTNRCWNCNAAPVFLFCEACRCVQPVDHSIHYFRILGLEKKYDVQEENLEGKYKDWQKKLHPDLVHTKSQEEREYAAEQSARVTTAYRTLSDPIARAIYILKLEGVDVDEEERISDPELLSEIMEIREAVEEAPDAKTLNQIQEQMQKELGNWSRVFTDAFQSRNYDKALASIQRMTYYKRAIEEVIKKL